MVNNALQETETEQTATTVDIYNVALFIRPSAAMPLILLMGWQEGGAKASQSQKKPRH